MLFNTLDPLAELVLDGSDGPSSAGQAIELGHEAVSGSLQLLLLCAADNGKFLKWGRIPFKNIKPVHGFITGPRATSPIGACSPGV